MGNGLSRLFRMIKKTITFVVGAGSSCSFGLPSGQDLVTRARSLTPESRVFRLLQECEFDPGLLNQLVHELREDFSAASIDQFLDARQDRPEVVHAGRALIAGLLGAVIATDNHDRPRMSDDDWLMLLLQKMRDGAGRSCSEFLDRNQGVRFVTFNFDSLIEERMLQAIRAMFPRATDAELDRAQAQLEVVHVHGRLPPPPPVELEFEAKFGGYPQWAGWLKAATPCVRVVFDDIEEAVVERARQAIRESRTVCFLGFAYSTENLHRLGVIGPMANGPLMVGSSFGLSRSDREQIKSRIGDAGGPALELGEGLRCRATLEHFPIFRE